MRREARGQAGHEVRGPPATGLAPAFSQSSALPSRTVGLLRWEADRATRGMDGRRPPSLRTQLLPSSSEAPVALAVHAALLLYLAGSKSRSRPKGEAGCPGHLEEQAIVVAPPSSGRACRNPLGDARGL